MCVRWSSNEDILASAAQDNTAKLIDFKTGKIIHTEKTPDGSKSFNLSSHTFHSIY